MNGVPQFCRYVGIDYSGAETATSSLKGLQVYVATPNEPPMEVAPPPGPRRYWSRRAIAEWLVERMRQANPGQGRAAAFQRAGVSWATSDSFL